MKKIGTVIKSNSHLEYVVQLLNPRTNLAASDYALGAFVIIGDKTVGIIYDTELSNPNNLIISSQKEELKVYAPDLQDEIDILLKVLLLGTIETNNNLISGNQNIPSELLEAGIEVKQASIEQIKQFHFSQEDKVQVKYLVNLNNFGSKLNPGLFRCISSQLKNILSEEQYRIIETIERNLLWTSLCKTD
jgi:hypothetical protein